MAPKYRENEKKAPPPKPRKIAMEYRKNKRSRMVTFTKRRNGLFSMARNLSARTGAKIAAIAISEAGRPFVDGSMALIDRFLPDESNKPTAAGLEDWVDETLAEGSSFGDLIELRREAEGLRDCLLARLMEMKGR